MFKIQFKPWAWFVLVLSLLVALVLVRFLWWGNSIQVRSESTVLILFPHEDSAENPDDSLLAEGDVRIVLTSQDSGWPFLYGVSLATLWDQFLAGKPTFRAFVEHSWLGKANRSHWPAGMVDSCYWLKVQQKSVQIYTDKGWQEFCSAEEAFVYCYAVMLISTADPNTLSLAPSMVYNANATPEHPAAHFTTPHYLDDDWLIELALSLMETGQGKFEERLRPSLGYGETAR